MTSSVAPQPIPSNLAKPEINIPLPSIHHQYSNFRHPVKSKAFPTRISPKSFINNVIKKSFNALSPQILPSVNEKVSPPPTIRNKRYSEISSDSDSQRSSTLILTSQLQIEELKLGHCLHSKSYNTCLQFGQKSEVSRIPAFQVDPILSERLRNLLPTCLYLNLNLCSINEKNPPIADYNDKDQPTSIPWPTYHPKDCPDHNYVPNNTKLKATTLPNLIHQLSCYGVTDNNLMIDFLRIYHYVVSSHDFLRLILARYLSGVFYLENYEKNLNSTSQNCDTIDEDREWINIIQFKVLNLLKKWVHHYQGIIQQDLQLSRFIQDILDFIATTEPTREPFVQSMIRDLQPNYLNLLHQLNNSSTNRVLQLGLDLKMLMHPTSPQFDGQFPMNNYHILNIDVDHLAQQITLIEHRLFCSIRPEELYHQTWNDRNHRHLTSPHVWTLIQLFNQVANWVTHTILHSTSSNFRSQVLIKFIKLANQCYQLNNFNTPFEILAGLHSTGITRLYSVWESIPPKIKQMYNNLNQALSFQDNYKLYRGRVKQLQNPNQFPILPFIGITLTDLVFSENGNPTYLTKQSHPNLKHPEQSGLPLVNVSKLRLMSKIMDQFQQFQTMTYEFEDDYCLQFWLVVQLVQTSNDDNSKIPE
jgi:hypothetical protein